MVESFSITQQDFDNNHTNTNGVVSKKNICGKLRRGCCVYDDDEDERSLGGDTFVSSISSSHQNGTSSQRKSGCFRGTKMGSTVELGSSFPVQTVVDGSDNQDLSPCGRRYTFGATFDVSKYRRSGTSANSAFNHNAGVQNWFLPDASVTKRSQTSPHYGTSVAVPVSGHGIAIGTLVEAEEAARMLTSSSSSSSPRSSVAVLYRAVGARSASGLRPSSASGVVVRPEAAARPTDLDFGSSMFDDDGQYRRRTYSMPTGGGGGQLHGPGSAAAAGASALARSAACRRAHSRRIREEQLQHRGNGNTSGDSGSGGGGHDGSSSAGVDGWTEYVRVRSFSTSSRGVKNRGDSFKRRLVIPASGARSALSSSSSALATFPSSANSTARGCQQPQHLHAPLGTSRSHGRLASSAVHALNGDACGWCVGVTSHEDDHLDSDRLGCGCSRVTVIGDPDVGKRSIVRQTMTSEYMHGRVDSSPTNDDCDEHQTVDVLVDNEESTLLFAVKNSIVLQPLQPQHSISDEVSAPISDCYCVVYSVADRATFNSAVLTLSLLNRRLGTEIMAWWTACILVGNKSDLVRQRQVDEDEGKAVAARYRCKFVEVSAVLNYKVDELLVGIVTQIRLRRRRQRNKPTTSDPVAPVDCDAVSGCYRQARGVVHMLFGKHHKRRLFRSCDNLLSL